MKLSTESLARAASRHPWRTVIVWVVALLAAAVLSSSFLGDALTTDTDFTDEPDSKRAAGLLEAAAAWSRGGHRVRRGDARTPRSPILSTEAFVGDLQADDRCTRA